MCVCVCAYVYMHVCVRALHGAPQTEVRRSLEQVQIERNLIPHCAGTGMKLHNCTLIGDRTSPSSPTSSPLSPLLYFFFLLSLSLCVLGPKSLTGAGGHNCLLVSVFSSFLSVPMEASNNVCLSNQEVNVVRIRAIINQ